MVLEIQRNRQIYQFIWFGYTGITDLKEIQESQHTLKRGGLTSFIGPEPTSWGETHLKIQNKGTSRQNIAAVETSWIETCRENPSLKNKNIPRCVAKTCIVTDFFTGHCQFWKHLVGSGLEDVK